MTDWKVPTKPGKATLMARATDSKGRTQTTERDMDRLSYFVNHLLPRVLARWKSFPAALAQSLSKSGPIVVVIVGTAIAGAFHLGARNGVMIIGEIPSGLPRLAIPALAASEFLPLIPLALTVSFIGLAEGFNAGLAEPNVRSSNRALSGCGWRKSSTIPRP